MSVKGIEDRRVAKAEEVKACRIRSFRRKWHPGWHDEHVAASHTPLASADGDRARPIEDLVDRDPTSRRVSVWTPARTRCISARRVGNTSPPLVGFVKRTAACPGLSVDTSPSSSNASCSVSARSVSTHRYASKGVAVSASVLATGRSPGWPHSRSDRERSGVACSIREICSRPTSKNWLSVWCENGMSSPSIQAIGSVAAL